LGEYHELFGNGVVVWTAGGGAGDGGGFLNVSWGIAV